MLRWPRNRRRLAALFLPFLAATLACNALSSGGAAGGAALTQAAATVTAAANQAATIPTQAPTAAPPTSASSSSAAVTITPAASPTAAAVTDTPAAAATTVTSATAVTTPGAAVVLDPCTLVTVDQAKALTGVDMGAPKAQGGGCSIADAATGQNVGLIIYALPASQSQAFLNQFVPSLKQSGVTIDPKLAAQFQADVAAGDTVAAVNDLTAMSINQPKYHAVKVDGLGDAAVWSWNSFLGVQEGLLMTARPGVVVALGYIAPATAKEADAKPAMQQMVSTILAGLPPSFTVAGLQVAGSAPALDPCSLATATDVDHIMGTQTEDGTAANGLCNFTDVATHKLQVRVLALPSGAAAANVVNLAALTMLVGDKTTQDKVSADLAAGDLVAAIRDMGAASHTGKYFLSVIHGVGDTAFSYIQTVGTERIFYFFAATPTALVGVEGLLGTGDDKTTSDAALEVVSRVMTALPDKFTVNGVP